MNSEYPNQEVANINTFRKRKDQTYYLLKSFFRCTLIFHNDLHIRNKLSNEPSIPSNRVYKAQKPWNSFFIFSFSHTFCIACGKQTRKKRTKKTRMNVKNENAKRVEIKTTNEIYNEMKAVISRALRNSCWVLGPITDINWPRLFLLFSLVPCLLFLSLLLLLAVDS